MGWIMQRYTLTPSVLPKIADLFNDPARFALVRQWFQANVMGHYALGDIEAVVFNVAQLKDDLNLPNDNWTVGKWQRWVAFLRGFYAPAPRHADRDKITQAIADVLGDLTNTKTMNLTFVGTGYQSPEILVQGTVTTIRIYH